ncbi:ATP-binding protein, partial [Escherichia coli]|uniref:ATP-binding protein n=1 Tax=Escherichia coli TaxID=562 RepID=UPI0011BA6AD1
STTVAPAPTLTDKEDQIMRNATMAVLRAIGVATSYSNLPLTVHPYNGRLLVHQMDPRCSHSSPLQPQSPTSLLDTAPDTLLVHSSLHHLYTASHTQHILL